MSSPDVKTTDMESDASSSDITRTTETTQLTKRTQQPKSAEKKKMKKKKRVTVTVGTTGGSDRVAGLIALLRDMDNIVETVNFREIPYNIADMNDVDFDDVDVFILCHSINNRRLSITDVSDALYDELIDRACRKLGKENVIIFGYDFKDSELQADALASKLNAFQVQQPTACSKSSAVVFAGHCASMPLTLPEGMMEKLRSSLQASSPRKRSFIRRFCCCLCCCLR